MNRSGYISDTVSVAFAIMIFKSNDSLEVWNLLLTYGYVLSESMHVVGKQLTSAAACRLL
jgi:hypothetical protein